MGEQSKLDILEEYTYIFTNPNCRNAKRAQPKDPLDTGGGSLSFEQRRLHYRRLSLEAVPSQIDLISYLERNLDISQSDFTKLLYQELYLHVFADDHKKHKDNIKLLKRYLCRRKNKIKVMFRENFQSDFVTSWIYWNKCKTVTSALKSVLIMIYDSFILFHDVLNMRRCIYRTTVNSGGASTLATGSIYYPVFAYAENGIFFPNIFVISYPCMKTVSKLRDHTKGRYIGMSFSYKKTLITLKLRYANNGYRFILWNWPVCEKLIVYEEEPSKDLHSDNILFHWKETVGLGVFMQRNTTYKDNRLTSVIHITAFKHKGFEKLYVLYKVKEKFYQSFIPADVSFTDDSKIFILDTKGDLYELAGFVKCKLVLVKRWARNGRVNRPECPPKIFNYKDGFLIYGPQGIIKKYSMDAKKEWHCIWWMDLFDTKAHCLSLFGSLDHLYLVYPDNGILRLGEDHRFQMVYGFEKLHIQEVILIQPAGIYMLAISDRRTILVIRVKDGKKMNIISFPPKFDKYPFLASSGYPYVVFISDRVGKFYLFDISDVNNPYTAAEIKIGPNRITRATVTSEGMLMTMWVGSVGMSFIYWAVKSDDSYSNFKVFLTFPSEEPVLVCPYTNQYEETYILIMEKKQEKLIGNEVFFYKFPGKQFIGVCNLGDTYCNLHFPWMIGGCIFANRTSNPNILDRFVFKFIQCGNDTRVTVAKQCSAHELPHLGAFEIIFGYKSIYSYGLEDGLLVINATTKKKGFKRIFSAYLHRGFIVNYESNKFGNGGIRRCFISRCGGQVIVLAQNGTLSTHHFRRILKVTAGTENYFNNLFRNIELEPAASCISLSMPTKNRQVVHNDPDKHTLELFHDRVGKKQELVPQSKWALIYGSRFYLNLVAECPSVSENSQEESDADKPTARTKHLSEIKIKLIRKSIIQSFWHIQYTLLHLLRDHYRNGIMSLPFTLFIIDRKVLEDFFARLDYVVEYTEANIRRKMVRKLKKLYNYVSILRKPFYNAELIRGMLNPLIVSYTIGRRVGSDGLKLKRLCSIQWYERKVLSCGYCEARVFPLHSKLQKKVQVSQIVYPEISCLRAPEVLQVSKIKEEEPMKRSEIDNVHHLINEATYEKDLRYALEYFKTRALLKSTKQNTGLKIIDYDGIWKALCTPKTYRTLEAMEGAIGKGIDSDEQRVKLQRNPRFFLEHLLNASAGQFYELKNRMVCKNCKKLSVYSSCDHNPKCYPCFHVLRCPLNKHVFCSTTVIMKDPNVPDSLFWKPLRDLSDYKFTLHPHGLSCSLEMNKDDVIANPSLEPALRHQLINMFNKDTYSHCRFNEVEGTRSKKGGGEVAEVNSFTVSDETKETTSEGGDKIWDESLNESIKLVNRAEDIEALFRELFFKGSRCMFCKEDKQYLLIKEIKHFMKYTPFFPLHTLLALPWLVELVNQIKRLRNVSGRDDLYDKMLKDFPEILEYKKDEYFDSFMIPSWDDGLIRMITRSRKYLNLKLAKIYVMHSSKNLITDADDAGSEASFGSDIARSPADIICGYRKVSPDEITDAALNVVAHKSPNHTVKTYYPTSDKMVAKIYDKQLKKMVLQPLKEGAVVDPLVAYFYGKKQPLKLSLVREHEEPKIFETDSKSDLCPSWFTEFNDNELSIVKSARVDKKFIPEECFHDWESGAKNTMLPIRFMLKCNTFNPRNPLYKPIFNEKGTMDLFQHNGDLYRVVKLKDLSDPFVPFQPLRPNNKQWRPFTLKLLLDSKKPLPKQLMPNIKRLLSEELAPDCFKWLKALVELIIELRDLVESKLSSTNYINIRRQHFKDYTKDNELYYPIRPIETARWIAYLIHKLTIINNDVIDNTDRILAFYTSSKAYQKNPFLFTKKELSRKQPSYDPRLALKAGFSARYSAEDNKNLLDELKRTDLLFYDHKVYQPDGELRDLMYGQKENKQYQLRLLINRKLLELSSSLADLNKVPKSWFEWNPIQQGAPNWVLLLSTALGVQIFCCTLNNIQRRLYQILEDTQEYIPRKQPKIRRKRVRIYERPDLEEGNMLVKPLGSNQQLLDVVVEQMRIDRKRTRKKMDNIFKTDKGLSKGELNYQKLQNRYREINKKDNSRNQFESRLKMQEKVKEMVTGDVYGKEMFLERKKCWFEYFSTKPLHAGYPPVYDTKPRDPDSLWPAENIWESILSPVNRFSNFLKEYSPSDEPDADADKESIAIILKREEAEMRKKKEIFFMKMLILDGPIARYTMLNNYYSHRFEYFLPMKSKELNAIVALTTNRMLAERYRIIRSVRHLKHNIINIMLVIHLRKQQQKRQMAFFCENYDYKTTYYKREIKLIPDEKLNYLYEVDDEDNMYTKSGKLKKQPPHKMFEYEPQFQQSYPEAALTQIIEGSLRNTNMGTLLRPPFSIKADNLDCLNSLTVKQRKKLEKYSKKLIILDRDRDTVVMEYKNKLGWFSVYEQWFKWSFDYTLAYYAVFQLNGMENAIRSEERKANQIKKMKWEMRKIIYHIHEIRRSYLKITSEYLYLRAVILADISFFRTLKVHMKRLYDRIGDLDAKQDTLKGRILRENPYLKETTLDKLLNPTISLALLKDATVQELMNGYKFYYQRKKPVHYFYEIHPKLGEYYQQVRSLNDIRLYPLMGYELRKEVIEIRMEKQLLHYKVHTGHKRAEDFHARLKRTYSHIRVVLGSLIKLHITCYEKLVLLKRIMHQQNMTVTVFRKNLEKPLIELIKPLLEGKNLRFFAMPSPPKNPKIMKMRRLRTFKESLISDRIHEMFAIRKTIIAEMKLKKLYLTLMNMQFVRYLDGTCEDVIQHFKDYSVTSMNSAIPTQIKGFDKAVPKIHLNQLIFNYLEYLKKNKETKNRKEKLKKGSADLKLFYNQKYCPLSTVRRAWSSGPIAESKQHSNLCHHYGLMAWLIKNLWDVSDYEEAYIKGGASFFESSDQELVDSVEGECSPASHMNKVLDYLHCLITPRVPPPSPANSDSLPRPVRMLLLAQIDSVDIAFQQDIIIYDYLKNQLLSFLQSLKESNMSLKDEKTKKEIEKSFNKWIAKLFENWHIRVPLSRPVDLNEAACTLLDTAVTNPETENIEQLLLGLIKNHSETLASRNIDHVRSDIAFTEHENKLTKCSERLKELPPLIVNEQELTDEGSGAEKECSLSVYAKFEGHHERKLSNEQSLLILKLINEHIKKYNKDTLAPKEHCKHDQSFRADLLKEWIAYAFGEVFLLPVQYVFIRAGDRLIKMYDVTENAIKVKCYQTKALRARQAVTSFLEDYSKFDESYRLVNTSIKEAEETRKNVREPLLKKTGYLRRKLEKLRNDNKRLRKVLEKEKRRAFPVFGREIVPINLELGKLFLSPQ